jgi:hypothetical protein
MKNKLFIAFILLSSIANAQFCNGTVTYTTCSGSVTDGSGGSNYADNSDCYWLIQPSGATTIALEFVGGFQVGPGDFVVVYDGATTAAPMYGPYSTNPPTTVIYSTGGSLLIHFQSDAAITDQGWSANWSCNTVGIEENNGILNNIYPNPFNLETTIQLNKTTTNAQLNIYNFQGQVVRTITNISADKIIIEREELPAGLYFIQLAQENQTIMRSKIIISE